MKTIYLAVFSLFILSEIPVHAQNAKPPLIDLPALKKLPEGKYTVNLELKQLDGKAATLTLESRDGAITGSTGRFGQIRGRVQPIGNGVFLVQLRGTGYVATQYWVFRPDGIADIKEIPERGEKQTAVPQ